MNKNFNKTSSDKSNPFILLIPFPEKENDKSFNKIRKNKERPNYFKFEISL